MINFELFAKFDWDEGNSDKNWLKHKVSIVESEEVFSQRPVIILPDDKHFQKTENRFHAFGKTSVNRLLIICFTIRNKNIRVISARPMNARERNFYENQK